MSKWVVVIWDMNYGDYSPVAVFDTKDEAVVYAKLHTKGVAEADTADNQYGRYLAVHEAHSTAEYHIWEVAQ